MENDSNYENTEMFLPSQFGWLPYRLYSYARGMGGGGKKPKRCYICSWCCNRKEQCVYNPPPLCLLQSATVTQLTRRQLKRDNGNKWKQIFIPFFNLFENLLVTFYLMELTAVYNINKTMIVKNTQSTIQPLFDIYANIWGTSVIIFSFFLGKPVGVWDMLNGLPF